MQKDAMSETWIYRSCRVHDLVLEFCQFKGLDEELFEIAGSTKVGPHTRRLAVDLSKYRGDNNSILFHSPDKILSLLIFDTFESAEKKAAWPSGINELKEFIHLRILNFDGVDFKVRKIPKGLDRLALLRYLSFRGCRLEELPPSLSNLTQLETLDLFAQEECEILIPNNFFTNMKRMLHLYFPKLYKTSGKTKLQLQAMEGLEILVHFDTEVCDVKALPELKNLKALSTISNGQSEGLDKVIDFINNHQGSLRHSSVHITSFDCYNKRSVSALKKLVCCQSVHSIHIKGQIGELPQAQGDNNVERKVSEMVLDGSELEADPMDYLGKTFPNLRSLVLSNDAFLGGEMVVSVHFPNLRSLKLQNLHYLEKMTIESETMPELSTLQIDGCDCLNVLSIPEELKERLRDNGGDAYSIMPP